MLIARRQLLRGLFAMPAVIAYDRLMPVRGPGIVVPEPMLEQGVLAEPLLPVWQYRVLVNGEMYLVQQGYPPAGSDNMEMVWLPARKDGVRWIAAGELKVPVPPIARAV